jgi:cation transport regulator ChaB
MRFQIFRSLTHVTNDDLLISIREAFNHAWQQYADDPRHEEIAHRVS